MKNVFCPRWDSNPRPPAFAASVLTARPNINFKVLKLIKQNLMLNLDDIKLKRFDLHWLIESIPEGFWILYPMPDGIWLGAFVGNTFKVF